LGILAVAILILSTGVAYGIAAQPQNQQNGTPATMARGSGYGGGMMGGQTGITGGMMAGRGGMMGGFASMMGSIGSTMGRYGGMMSQMLQHMANYWNQPHIGAQNARIVAVMDYAFFPSSITVPKGTTVTWVNMDFIQHTMASGVDGAPTGAFDSHPLGHMQSFSYTFTTPGTYPYYCDLHPDMTGTVTVTG
jgi:plastocyanin